MRAACAALGAAPSRSRRAALLLDQVQPGIPVQEVFHLHPVPGGPEVIRDGPAEVVEPRIVVVLRHRLLQQVPALLDDVQLEYAHPASGRIARLTRAIKASVNEDAVIPVWCP